MEKSPAAELLALAARSEPIARQLALIQRRSWPVRFSHVTGSAQPFLAATLAAKIDKTIWILCPSVHSQELLHEALLNWHPAALFLPEAEFTAIENVLPDPQIAAERLALFSLLAGESGRHLIVATRTGLEQVAPRPGTLNSNVFSLRRGEAHQMHALLERFTAAGYERVAQVTTRGQFAVRGGIVDVYSWQSSLPVRIEFFGDEIESLREFDIDTQISARDLNATDILLGAGDQQDGKVRDYIAPDHLKIDVEPEDKSNAEIQISEGWIEEGREDFKGAFTSAASEVGDFASGDFALVEAKRAQFLKRLNKWRENNSRIAIYFQTEGEIERFREIIGDRAALENVDLIEGTLARGFCFPAANLVVLSGAELFGRYAVHARRRLRRAERQRAQI
ncbi:MAG TPA: transcription-repair coupling factor, partial [Chthoniobacterales bacterium]